MRTAKAEGAVGFIGDPQYGVEGDSVVERLPQQLPEQAIYTAQLIHPGDGQERDK